MPPVYILVENAIVEVTPEEAVRWHAKVANRCIAKTRLDGEGHYVSTVFLGNNAGTAKQPKWFETLVHLWRNEYHQHSASKRQALETHQQLVEQARARIVRKKTPSA